MSEEWTETIVAGHQHADQGPKRGTGAIKMLKIKVDPEMYMKTKDRLTQWPIIIRAFVPGWHRFYKNGRKSIGLFSGKCTFDAIIGARPVPKSAPRFMGPSIDRLRTESFLDGATVRWPDAQIIFPFHYVLANKKG
jgi:hypothetical protein